jgi:hypothetical protein
MILSWSQEDFWMATLELPITSELIWSEHEDLISEAGDNPINFVSIIYYSKHFIFFIIYERAR